MTSPARQLSVINDIELSDAMFPDEEPLCETVYTTQTDNDSLVSFVDSGLGVSVKSSNLSVDAVNTTRSKPMPISGSLPATAARPIPSLAAIFGKRGEFQSKSWSDIWDEDAEAENAMNSDHENDDNAFFRRDSLASLSSASNGSDTPRVGLSEMNPDIVNNARATPIKVNKVDEAVSEHTGFLFEEHVPEDLSVKTPTPELPMAHKYSPPSKRSILDKWAALGDKRRGQSTPIKSESRTISKVIAPMTPNKRAKPNPSSKGLNWNMWGQGHRNLNASSPVLSPDAKKEWSASKDWRRTEKSLRTEQMEANKGRALEWVWRI
jgi:hypothetical protein